MAGNEPVDAEAGAASPSPSALPPIVGAETAHNPWARSNDPVPGITYSTPIPPPPPVRSPAPLPPVARPIEPPAAAQPASTQAEPPARRRRWVRSAKIAVGILAVTTIGAAVWGLGEASTVTKKTEQIDGLSSDLNRANADITRLAGDVEAAEKTAEETATRAKEAIDEMQGRLTAVTRERDDAIARVRVLEGLFPLEAATFYSADPTGRYDLSITPLPEVCTGYSSEAETACGAKAFPPDLAIVGDTTAGFTVSSTWFAAFGVADGAGRLVGAGQLNTEYINQCDGVDVPTEIAVSINRATITPVGEGNLKVIQVAGRMTISTVEQAGCQASSRAADFIGELRA